MMLQIPEFPDIQKIKTMAVLTSGGDAPGMNAAIRAVVRYALSKDCTVYGITKGYSGLLEGQIHPLEASSVANIIQRGGTILKTDRCAAFFKKSVRREAAHILQRKGIEGLIVIGGDGSFTGAHLMETETGFPTIGIPGTIDNDIAVTEDTIGFDTAVNTAIDAIDRTIVFSWSKSWDAVRATSHCTRGSAAARRRSSCPNARSQLPKYARPSNAESAGARAAVS
jgi:6-phosphofructokinase 1